MKYLLLAGALLCVVANANGRYCPICHQRTAVGCWITRQYEICPPHTECGYTVREIRRNRYMHTRSCMPTLTCVRFDAMGKERCRRRLCITCNPPSPVDVPGPPSMDFPPDYGVTFSRGDPHYKSFDSLHTVELQCLCWTTMVRNHCSNGIPGGFYNFAVHIRADPTGYKDHTRVGAVQVEFNRKVLEMGADRTHVKYDGANKELIGTSMTTPDSFSMGELCLIDRGNATMLTLRNGVTVLWDFEGEVSVGVPNNYPGSLCGLGGNFNEDPSDDMKYGDVDKVARICPSQTIKLNSANARAGDRVLEENKDLFAISWIHNVDTGSQSCVALCLP